MHVASRLIFYAFSKSKMAATPVLAVFKNDAFISNIYGKLKL